MRGVPSGKAASSPPAPSAAVAAVGEPAGDASRSRAALELDPQPVLGVGELQPTGGVVRVSLVPGQQTATNLSAPGVGVELDRVRPLLGAASSTSTCRRASPPRVEVRSSP